MKATYPKKCLIGKKFERWFILDFIEYRGKKCKQYWLCLCDCGKIVEVRGDGLCNGTSRSCGCLKNEEFGLRTRGNKLRRKAYGEAALNTIYGSYKIGAKKRNHEFDLSKNEFKRLISKNCYYCDKKPKQIRKQKDTYGEYIYNGIDRVNNKLGYNKKNCVTCCKFCNIMKLDLTQKEFYKHIEKIYVKYKIRRIYE